MQASIEVRNTQAEVRGNAAQDQNIAAIPAWLHLLEAQAQHVP